MTTFLTPGGHEEFPFMKKKDSFLSNYGRVGQVSKYVNELDIQKLREWVSK